MGSLGEMYHSICVFFSKILWTRRTPDGFMDGLVHHYKECLHKLHGSLKRSSEPIRLEKYQLSKRLTNNHPPETYAMKTLDNNKLTWLIDALKYVHRDDQPLHNETPEEYTYETNLEEEEDVYDMDGNQRTSDLQTPCIDRLDIITIINKLVSVLERKLTRMERLMFKSYQAEQ